VDQHHRHLSISTPFGGFKQSGLGREKGLQGMRAYMLAKASTGALADHPASQGITYSSENTLKHPWSLPTLLLAGAVCTYGTARAQTQAPAQCEPQRSAEKYPRYAATGVKIGTVTTSPPFAYSDPADYTRMTGAEVEIVEAAMKCAGLNFTYVKGPFSTVLQSVISGAADVMIGNVNYRAERAERLDFITYMRSGQSMLVPRGNPKNLHNVLDLCGLTESSTVGGVGFAEVEKQSPACQQQGKPPITYLPSVDQESALRQVVNGRVDFVMDGSITAKQRALGHNAEFDIAFTILTDLVIGATVRKDDPEMRQAVLEGVTILEREGRLKEIFTRYELQEFAAPVELRR
jgi:polar amino acid transport system substrate-binding protein